MGARQSKRSVDITTTPKKEGEIVEGEGRVEKIGDLDVSKVITNGSAHTDIEFADKDDEVKETDESAEKPTATPEIKENGVSEPENEKPQEAGDQPAKEATESTEKGTTETPEKCEKSEKIEDTPENKKKEKTKKKKWSIRSISFSKRDKTKPKDKDAAKNGEVKDINEEKAEEAVASPEAESPKTEEVKSPEEAPAAPLTNGDASKEELKTEEPAPKVEEPVAPVKEEPKPVVAAPEPVSEPIKTEPVVEAAPPAKEEPKAAEEVKPVVVEETKEVRNAVEDIPPPLPASNPPSPVTVFAESTKDNALPIVETIAAVVISETPSTIPEPEPIASETVITQSQPDILLEAKETVKEPEIVAEPVEEPKSVVDLIKEPEILVELIKESEAEELASESKNVEEPETVVEPEPVKEPEPLIKTEAVIEPETLTETVVEPIKEPEVVDPIPEPLVETPKTPEPVSEPKVEVTEPEAMSPPPRCESPLPPLESSPLYSTPLSEPVSATSDIVLPEPVDSLPDLSSESLPSLPDPCSEGLPEPMSLPPVDNFPEPLSESDSIPPPPPPSDDIPEKPVLTNGTTNGHHAPTNGAVDVSPPLSPPHDGAVKQIPDVAGDKCEIISTEKSSEVAEPTAAVVEE